MKNKILNKLLLIGLFFTNAVLSFAQETATSASKAAPLGLNNIMILVYLGVIGVLVLVTSGIVLNTLQMYQDLLLKSIAKEQGREVINVEIAQPATQSRFSKVWYQLVGTGGQTIEDNKDIQIDHPHDGIYELDNGMPPWLRNVFISCILFAFSYMWYYHFYQNGEKGQLYEYKMAIREGEVQKAEAADRQENSVSEATVVVLKDAEDLAAGKGIFIGKCAACHGQKGEGTVGPNMTDDYWIHGGTIKNLFTTIKYGVPDKGMISWKDQLKPKEMQEVASYVLTLRGTNPPNPKAPQGDLVQSEVITTDSTQSKK